MVGQSVQVGQRRLRLTNLGKVLYPADGFAKGEVIDYYVRIADAMLPHVAHRPLTMRRWPDGVDRQPFYDKDASRHAPDWLRVVRLPTPGSTKDHEEIGYAVLDELAALVWAGNMAGLELHVPQWTVGPRGGVRAPDRVVFDLDPGEPAAIVECCEVALWVREVLAQDGLECYPKTSGSKGMQVYASVTVSNADRTSRYAKEVAQRLEREHPELVVSRMAKNLRRGKVFVDWSQNNTAKTTIAPYSLRGRDRPTVSTPITWDEVERCRKPADLVFLARDVVDRVSEFGDLMAPLLDEGPKLP